MAQPRVLIAGVGNIFLGDDGFGVEVADRLAEIGTPEWVAVGDYGISGMHLAYDLADGIEMAILVDAMPRGGEPGTVYVVEPEQGSAFDGASLDGHGMQPDVVLSMLGTLGAKVPRVLIVGCEPECTDEGIGLSAPVAAAVDEAVKVVLGLLDKECTGGRSDVSWDTRRGDRVPSRPAGPGQGGGQRRPPRDQCGPAGR